MSETFTYTYVAAAIPGLPSFIQRSDGMTIPLHLDNMDYQSFLAWIAAGNAPPEGWTGPTNPTGANQ